MSSKLILLFYSTLIFCSFSFADVKNTGGMDSSGGSGLAGVFIDRAYAAAEMLRSIEGFPLTYQEFKDLIRTTHVEVVREDLYDKNGIRVDALNFPAQRLIRINKGAWHNLLAYGHSFKYQLIAHEYLNIAGFDDSDYKYSRLILGFTRILKHISCQTENKKEDNVIVIEYKEIDHNFENPRGRVIMEAYRRVEGQVAFTLPNPFIATVSNDPWGYLILWRVHRAYEAFFSGEILMMETGEFIVPYHEIVTNFPTHLEKQYAGNLHCQVLVGKKRK